MHGAQKHTRTSGISNCMAQHGHGVSRWLDPAAPEVGALAAPRLLNRSSTQGSIRTLGSTGFKFRGSWLYLQHMPLLLLLHPGKGNPPQGTASGAGDPDLYPSHPYVTHPTLFLPVTSRKSISHSSGLYQGVKGTPHIYPSKFESSDSSFLSSL